MKSETRMLSLSLVVFTLICAGYEIMFSLAGAAGEAAEESSDQSASSPDQSQSSSLPPVRKNFPEVAIFQVLSR